MRERLSNIVTRLVFGFVFLFSATTPMAQGGALENDLIGTAWVADDIGGRGVIDFARSTLEFMESGRIGGLTACNNYTGPVSFDADGGVAFGNLAATRKMCPEAIMEQERRFLEALAKADRLELGHGGQVLIAYADGAPILRLSRVVDK